MIRVPPLGVDRKGEGPVTARTMRGQGDAEVLSQMLLYEDPKVYRLRQAGRACRAGRLRASPAISTTCWKPGATPRARSRGWCTGSTATRPACWWWRARGLRR